MQGQRRWRGLWGVWRSPHPGETVGEKKILEGLASRDILAHTWANLAFPPRRPDVTKYSQETVERIKLGRSLVV